MVMKGKAVMGKESRVRSSVATSGKKRHIHNFLFPSRRLLRVETDSACENAQCSLLYVFLRNKNRDVFAPQCLKVLEE